VESVHPDHKYYFSRTTLHTLLAKSGLAPIKEYVYVFDVDYLPARRLEGALFFDGIGQMEPTRTPVGPATTRPAPASTSRGRPERDRTDRAECLSLSPDAILGRCLLVVCARDDDQPAAVAATGGQRRASATEDPGGTRNRERENHASARALRVSPSPLSLRPRLVKVFAARKTPGPAAAILRFSI